MVKVEVTSVENGRNVKCPRCWQYHGVIENYDNLCDKCQDTIINYFPDHESVTHIKESLDKQRIKYLKE